MVTYSPKIYYIARGKKHNIILIKRVKIETLRRKIKTTLALLMNMPELVRTSLSVLFPDRLSATADRFNSDLAYGIPRPKKTKGKKKENQNPDYPSKSNKETSYSSKKKKIFQIQIKINRSTK